MIVVDTVHLGIPISPWICSASVRFIRCELLSGQNVGTDEFIPR